MTPIPRRPPDLTVFRVLHRAMRIDAARLAAAVSRLDEHDRDRARAVARWYGGFHDQLVDHHHVEDTVFFPVLADRVPTFADHAGRIEREHHQLDEALADAGAALDELVDARRWAPAQAVAVDATIALREVVGTHLDFEDRDVLPLFLRHFTADEYGEMEQRVRKLASPAKLLFMVPWVVDAATPEERDHLFGRAPAAFKLLWYASRNRYGRLTGHALGTATPGAGVDRREVA